MEVFISWHGEASRRVAEALRDWLPRVLHGVKPFLSSEDIHKGDVWFGQLTDRLSVTRVGILCLTREALHADWILFEAGAMSKQVGQGRVIPVLLGLKPTDVVPPLSNFQAVQATRDDVLRMVQTINSTRSGANEEALSGEILRDTFDVWWPKLELRVREAEAALGAPASVPPRDQGDILLEILELVRGLAQRGGQSAHPIGYASFVNPFDESPEYYLRRLRRAMDGLVYEDKQKLMELFVESYRREIESKLMTARDRDDRPAASNPAAQ